MCFHNQRLQIHSLLTEEDRCKGGGRSLFWLRIIKLDVLRINVDGTVRNAAFYRQAVFFEYLQIHCGLKARDAFRSVDIGI
jgi:hypothetical protein